MKKIDLSNVVEGVRKLGSVKAFFEHIESAYISAMADLVHGIVASANTPTALHGCVNSGSGSTYNISAGAIFNNGEVFSIPAFNGTAGGGQVPVLTLVTVNAPLSYTDSTNQNTLVTRTYEWAFGASGSGLGDFGALVSLKTRINSNLLDVPGQITTQVNALIAAAPGALDTLNELAAAMGNDPNFATTMTNALAGKVAKAGDTMSGNLTIPDATAAGHAVNKGQVDAIFGTRTYSEQNVLVNSESITSSFERVDKSFSKIDTGESFDDFTQPGMYYMDGSSTPANRPSNNAQFVLVQKNATFVHQIAFDCGVSQIMRSRVKTISTGIWSAWFYFGDGNKADKSQPAWTNLSLINGWTNGGGASEPPRFRITDQNKLQITGRILVIGASDQVFATLPNGTLPASKLINVPIIVDTTNLATKLRITGGSPTTIAIPAFTGGTGDAYDINISIPLDSYHG